MVEFEDIIGSIEPKDTGEPLFDFSSPESVLIEIIGIADSPYERFTWNNFQIETCSIIVSTDNVIGAASYDHAYGAGLSYTIEQIIDPPGEGWYVVENITGHYIKGDWGFTEDDMEFYFDRVRPATEDEIKLA